MKPKKQIRAGKLPDGTGHQVSYEQGSSRKVHNFQSPKAGQELPPHGAGSFHNPEQHDELMDRVADFLKKGSA